MLILWWENKSTNGKHWAGLDRRAGDIFAGALVLQVMKLCRSVLKMAFVWSPVHLLVS